MTAPITPGAYLKMRRTAALLDVQDVAEQLQVEPPLPELARAEWLRLIEADAMPASFNTIAALRRRYPFSLVVLERLALIALGEPVDAPFLCLICGSEVVDLSEPINPAPAHLLCSDCAKADPEGEAA